MWRMSTMPVKTMTVGQLKADFSAVVDDLKRGREVAITYGRKKVPLATIVPQSKLKQPDYSVKLGTLEAKGWTYKMKDFEITTEEFLGL